MVAWSTCADGNVARWLVAGIAAASLGAAHAEPEASRAAAVPNDPLFDSQWPLANREHPGSDVGALKAWAYTRGSSEVLIAVLDDGVELDHPDLAANIAGAGRDFGLVAQGADASPRAPQDRHGTAVAGIVAARGDNGIGVTGVCPQCRILPVRVEGASSAGLAAAFRYAVEQGADVITNSWGYDPRRRLAADAELRAAIDHAATAGRGGRGALVVFGVPNDVADHCVGEHADLSSLPSVLAVGVSDHRDEVGGSGYGECLDLVAPAKPEKRGAAGVPTTDRTGIDGYTADAYFTEFGGTSAAAPLVAGIAGLLLALDPELTRAELQAILEQTADKIDAGHAAYDANGFSPRAGHGRVNAARAVRAVVERSHAVSR